MWANFRECAVSCESIYQMSTRLVRAAATGVCVCATQGILVGGLGADPSLTDAQSFFDAIT